MPDTSPSLRGPRSVELEADPSREQRDDELVERAALLGGGRDELLVQAGGGADEDLPVGCHAPKDIAYAIAIGSSACNITRMDNRATQAPVTQHQLDEIAFDMYVDCGRRLGETSRQLGVAPSTVRGRVNRHSRRLNADDYSTEYAIWTSDDGGPIEGPLYGRVTAERRLRELIAEDPENAEDLSIVLWADSVEENECDGECIGCDDHDQCSGWRPS